MTRAEINATIDALAKANGFTTKDSYNGFREIRAENLNFFTQADTTFNMEERCITTKVTMRVSISRMGGNPTTDELFAVANEIQHGAAVVETINLLGMECTETFEELEA